MPKSGQSYAQALGRLRRAKINQWAIPAEDVAGIEKAIRDRVDEAVTEKIQGKAKIAAITQLFEDLRTMLKICAKDKGGADRPKEKIASEILAKVQELIDLSTETEKS